MEEKILIKSCLDEKWSEGIKIIIIVLLVLAAIFLMSAFMVNGVKYDYYSKRAYPQYCHNALEYLKRYWLGDWNGGHDCLILIIINWMFLILSGLATIMYFVLKKCELQITENNVTGKTLFGKSVVLPISQVSAVMTRSFLSTIAVATSLGSTKFSLIGNYAECGKVLQDLITAKKESASLSELGVKEKPSSFDELKKLKELLDGGIITQEEFDSKKKQLLSL